jgi:hypothetical protein
MTSLKYSQLIGEIGAIDPLFLCHLPSNNLAVNNQTNVGENDHELIHLLLPIYQYIAFRIAASIIWLI